MAYSNTGYARCKTLTIVKGDESKSFKITDGFSSKYTALTDDQFAKMTDSAYEQRRTAFIDYIYSEYEGLEEDCPDLTINSCIYNVELCPIKQ